MKASSLIFSAPVMVALALSGVLACSSDSAKTAPTDDEPSDAAPGTVVEPVRCVPPPVDRFKELMIVDPTVVEDAVRTKPGGPWSFRHVMEEMAPTPETAPAFVEAWINEWSVTTVNGFPLTPKPAGTTKFLKDWPRTASGDLDLDQAPLKLIAISNRLDLRDKTRTDSAGEGRFVFAVQQGGSPASFTVILEYVLPTDDTKDVTFWVNQWHGLGAVAQGERYNAALEKLTRQFTDRGASPSRPNGSALGQLRTNELMLGDPWELREFRIGDGGQLHASTTLQAPDQSLNGADALAQFVKDNADTVSRGTHVVPPEMLGGVAPETDASIWKIPGVEEDLRHAFALQTCNGCHTTETKSKDGFFHVSPTGSGTARLSVFLNDTADSTNDELARRAGELSLLTCGVSDDHTPPSSGPGTAPIPN